MQEIKYIDINLLKSHPNNPRVIKDRQFKVLCESIEKNKDYFEARPILCNKDMVIFAGNMRYRAAQKIGLKEVPVAIMDIPEERQKEIMIRDNRSNGEFNFDVLANNFDVNELMKLGFEEKELLGSSFDFFPSEEKDDKIPEMPQTPPIVQRADVWQLGRHRVMCGDSTKKEDVERLMDGKKADMVFTDPPYGMNLDTDYSKNKGGGGLGLVNAGKKHRPVIGDDKPFDPAFIFELFGYCKEIFLWGGDYYHLRLPENSGWIVWDKTGGNDSLMDAGFGANFELCWSKQKHKRDIARITWKGVAGRAGEKTVHPTQKSVKLFEWFFKRWGKENDIVWDGFLGSGSTLIACEKTNRICYGMELDEKYCDVIIKRWEEFSGQRAIKI
jgi:DNA modification methylase